MTEAENLGKKIYLAAMIRGAGSPKRQARELLLLNDQDFLSATRFAVDLSVHPELFQDTAEQVNRIHAAVNKSFGRDAPTDISAYRFYEDMKYTLQSSIYGTPDEIRRSRLTEVLMRLATIETQILGLAT